MSGFLKSVRWYIIGLSDCPVYQNDWCVRRHALSVVKDHDGPCPSLCVFECLYVYVLTCLSALLVYQCACRLAWVFCACDWTLRACVLLIDVMYLRVTNVLPAPAVFDLGLMGTHLPYSLIRLGIIKRRLWSWVGGQSCHWDVKLWKPYSLSSCSKSNIFSISTCLSSV